MRSTLLMTAALFTCVWLSGCSDWEQVGSPEVVQLSPFDDDDSTPEVPAADDDDVVADDDDAADLVELDCADGQDEDFDGLYDCSDPDCFEATECTLEDCATDMDEDGDGLSGCDDPDCAGEQECDDELDDPSIGAVLELGSAQVSLVGEQGQAVGGWTGSYLLDGELDLGDGPVSCPGEFDVVGLAEPSTPNLCAGCVAAFSLQYELLQDPCGVYGWMTAVSWTVAFSTDGDQLMLADAGGWVPVWEISLLLFETGVDEAGEATFEADLEYEVETPWGG